MKILISHKSATEQKRIAQKVSQTTYCEFVDSVRDLTSTYHCVEHSPPDFVIIQAELAYCADFELLSSLLNILGVGCIIFGDSRPPESLSPLFENAILLGDSSSRNEIYNAVQTVCTQPNRQNRVAHFFHSQRRQKDHLILIGASTGGVDALVSILGNFPSDGPPTLVVQHTGSAYAPSLIRLLNSITNARVVAARQDEPLEPGKIYLSPDGTRHLLLEHRERPHVKLSSTGPVLGHRPSIDVLFHSAVPLAARVSAAILTGMGSDGAEGIKALKQAGAFTIGQDEETSIVYGMPRVALQNGGITKQLPLAQIGPSLLRSVQHRTDA